MAFFRSKRKPVESKALRPRNNQSNPTVPAHIAIIMDGNGRWAQSRGLPRVEGHRRGAQSVRRISEACRELGVRYLTLYCFSHENWKRPKEELDFLMGLLKTFLVQERPTLIKNDIRLAIIGRREAKTESHLRFALPSITDRDKKYSTPFLRLWPRSSPRSYRAKTSVNQPSQNTFTRLACLTRTCSSELAAKCALATICYGKSALANCGSPRRHGQNLISLI